ncbi:hypothetical protein Esi_0035_0100 [Ectocarpus siliculosus]|uniref:Uncharacterized protein n=1 Tax=Ectocarpus siliculosus TaxID=2880 RepID=D7FYV3_ECTSI|nr:hypothetical protein Esi_0035_0100 [Ectocarpus siliculosus]|eukprot:CBJ26595.1 hypothetical protein Esi_0035_0100 [Ectocarpus siliculosus]
MSPVRLETTTVASRLPPVPAFPSHVPPSLDKAAGAKSACPPAAAGVPAAPPAARVRGADKGDASPSRVLRDLAGQLGGQGASSRDGLGVVGKVGHAGGVAGAAGVSRQPGPGRPRQGDASLPTAPSIESEPRRRESALAVSGEAEEFLPDEERRRSLLDNRGDVQRRPWKAGTHCPRGGGARSFGGPFLHRRVLVPFQGE